MMQKFNQVKFLVADRNSTGAPWHHGFVFRTLTSFKPEKAYIWEHLFAKNKKYGENYEE